MSRSRLPRCLLAATVLLMPSLTAGAPVNCNPTGSPPMFASAGFFRGDTGNGLLIGNGFIVLAKPLQRCDQQSTPVECSKSDTRRPWQATVVTAAHVIEQACAGAPGVWKDVDGANWAPARLVLFPGYRLETTSGTVQISIDRKWCDEHSDALDAISGMPAGEKSSVGSPALDEKADIYVFKQTFLLPKRAIMVPYQVMMLPMSDQNVASYVWGFNARPEKGRYHSVQPPGSQQALRMYWGDLDATFSGPNQRPSGDYDLSVDAIWGQSGSPVGMIKDGKYGVFGVLTTTGAMSCNEAVRAARVEDDIGKNDTTSADRTTTAPLLVECASPIIQSRLKRASESASFVALAREPRWYSKFYGDVPAIPREVAAELMESRKLARKPDRTFYSDALQLVLGQLTPLEQILLAAQVERPDSDDDLLGEVCAHWEPGATLKMEQPR